MGVGFGIVGRGVRVGRGGNQDLNVGACVELGLGLVVGA